MKDCTTKLNSSSYSNLGPRDPEWGVVTTRPPGFFQRASNEYPQCMILCRNKKKILIQSNLVISNSLISNYRLSRGENLVPV